MEKEFNFNDDIELGTSVSKLRHNTETNKNTETDIDYDKLLANFNNSETINAKTNFNYDSVRNNMNTFTSNITDVRPKKSINMSQFAKNVEADLEKVNYIRAYNYNEPLPVNYTKNIVQNSQLQKLEQTINSTPDIIINKETKNKVSKKNIIEEYKDIILNVLIFILLNNKFVIEFIYDKIPFVKKHASPYPNLLIRSALFGLIIWSIKKFNI
jgi:hypothetical protein